MSCLSISSPNLPKRRVPELPTMAQDRHLGGAGQGEGNQLKGETRRGTWQKRGWGGGGEGWS